MIWERTDTSRAETGSSATTSGGETTRGAGDADALAFTAAQFMGEPVGEVCAQPHGRQYVEHPSVGFGAADFLGDQRFGDHISDAPARVEGGERVLEDNLHLAPHIQHLLARGRNDIEALMFAVQQDAALIRFDQAEEAAGDGGFAAAALADKAQAFTFVDGEGYIVNRLDVAHSTAEQAALDREEFTQIFDLQDRCVRHGTPVVSG